MKLKYEQVASVAQGAVRVCQIENGIQFHRFTEEQEKIYADSIFKGKETATAGVRLHFETDSKTLYMKVSTSEASSRMFFAHDLLVNGEYVDSLTNEGDRVFGEFDKTFDLGEGVKTVCIHFPWSVCSILEELSLDDGSFVTPVKKEKKLIAFGDSITQGYDAKNPIHRYAANLADALGAEEINKAIGAEKFCPWLADLRDDFEPDYISVAYGTNHWHHSKKEEFMASSEEFYANLVKHYPNTKIFALTPIWRKDRTDITAFRDFEEIGELIQGIADKYDNITCVSGRYFIPEDDTLFSDRYLHPNDEGFKYYAENLIKAIQ